MFLLTNLLHCLLKNNWKHIIYFLLYRSAKQLKISLLERRRPRFTSEVYEVLRECLKGTPRK